MTDQDKKLELNKSIIWVQMFFTAIAFSVICFFFWTQIHDTRSLEDYLDSKHKMVRGKIQKMNADIHTLDKRVEEAWRNNVAKPTEFNLFPESVPRCGGNDGIVFWRNYCRHSRDTNIEEARRQVIEQMPKETRERINNTMRDLEEFRATLSEEELDKLEQRTVKSKAQMLSMIASLLASRRQEAERQLPMMERSMAHPIEM